MKLTNFQDASCFVMEEMIYFHDYSLLFLVFIVSFVFYLMCKMVLAKNVNRFMLHNEKFEFFWIVFPLIFLICIALPSLHLLYLMEMSNTPHLTLKAIGHQWYWSYEYPEFLEDTTFSSYMVKTSDLIGSEKEKIPMFYRSMDSDFRVVLPMKKMIRVITTSDDVIHSWTVPVLGVKMDSVPGRLNQILVESDRPGIFFGQCSEICGTLHSFMPIVVEFVDMKKFFMWISKFFN